MPVHGADAAAACAFAAATSFALTLFGTTTVRQLWPVFANSSVALTAAVAGAEALGAKQQRPTASSVSPAGSSLQTANDVVASLLLSVALTLRPTSISE